MKHVVCLIILFVTTSSFARESVNKSSFRTIKLSATTQNYTGTKRLSFSEGSESYGGEASIDIGDARVRYFIRPRYNYSKGSQEFKKDTTIYSSKYEYTSLEAEVGAAFYPIVRQNKGLNLYMWIVGGASYNMLSIKNVPTGLDVKKDQNVIGAHYGGGVGAEYVINAKNTRKTKNWLINAEIGYRDGRAALAGNEVFELTTLGFSLGVGF